MLSAIKHCVYAMGTNNTQYMKWTLQKSLIACNMQDK